MTLQCNLSYSAGAVDRRRFMTLSAGVAIAGGVGCVMPAQAENATGSAHSPVRTGNGEWTYQTVPNWGELPAGTVFGGTHGGIAYDKAGLLYVSTQSATGVLVYNQDGKLQRTIAHAYPEVHSMVHVEESGKEYFYVTVQRGRRGRTGSF